MRKLLTILMVLIMIIIWIIFINTQKGAENKYKRDLETAKILYDMKAYDEALEKYQDSLDYKYTPEVIKKMGEIFLIQSNYDKAEVLIKSIEGQEKIELTNTYITHLLLLNKYKQINEFINENEFADFKEIKNELNRRFIISDKVFIDVIQKGEKVFLVSDGSSKYLIDDKQRRLLPKKYSDIIGFDEQRMLITIKVENIYRVIDTSENIKSSINADKIYRYTNDTYVDVNKNGFILRDRLNNVIHKSDYISNVSGNSFISIDNSIIKVLDLDLNEIVKMNGKSVKSNENNEAIFDNKIIVNENNSFIYDFKTEQKSDQYEDIDFSNGSLIAVKKGGKWGYINSDFEKIIDFKYDEAKSFTEDVGFVKIGNKWSLIDSNEEILTQDLYDDAMNFNKAGIGFVKQGDQWIMLKRAIKE